MRKTLNAQKILAIDCFDENILKTLPGYNMKGEINEVKALSDHLIVVEDYDKSTNTIAKNLAIASVVRLTLLYFWRFWS